MLIQLFEKIVIVWMLLLTAGTGFLVAWSIYIMVLSALGRPPFDDYDFRRSPRGR